MAESTDDGFQFVGRHAVRFEPPDVLFQRPDGDLTIDDIRKIVALMDTFSVPEKGFFALVDIAKVGRQDAASMKLPELARSTKNIRAIIYYNMSFYHRTLVDFFLRIAKFFNHPVLKVQFKIFATEAEARVWIKEERERDAV